MKNTLLNTVFTLSIALFASGCQTTQPEPQVAGRDIFVPSTVSVQGQALLKVLKEKKAYDRKVPSPENTAAWVALQEATEQATKLGAEKAIEVNEVIVTEKNLRGVPVLEIIPKDWKDDGKVLVYTHGGAYALFSAYSTLPSSGPMSRATGRKVISVDYTLVPIDNWEKIQGDVLKVFDALLAQGYTMDDIALYGDSAGGGLATSTILNLRDKGLGMPAVVVLWAPWVDLTNEGDSANSLSDEDPLLDYKNLLKPSALAFADGLDLNDPRVSPIYADFRKGFPPTLIQLGTKEIFLSTGVRLFQKLEAQGQVATLDVYEGMPHIFQQYGITESKIAIRKSAAFINKHLGN